MTGVENRLSRSLHALSRARLRDVFIRAVVLAGLLAALAVVGYLAAGRRPERALVIGVGALVCVVAVRSVHRIELWAVAILATAAFVRFSIGTGTESSIVASLALTGLVVALWLARMLVIERRLRLKPAPTNLPLLGFIVAATVSLVWGIAFRDPLVVIWSSFPLVQVASLVVMVLLPGVFLLVGNTIEDVRWLKAMVRVVLTAGTIGLAHEFLHVPLPFAVNVLGIFPMWASSIACSLALFDRRLRLWQRVLLLVFAAGWLLYGYPRRVSWLAAWVPSFAAMSVVTLMRSRWFILLIVIVFVFVGWRYVQTNLQGEMSESGRTRWEAWVQNWRVTSKHFLFGTGPAGYAVYYMSYFPTRAMATHSNYIDLFSQTGIVGLSFSLWFFGALVWVGYRLCLRLRKRSDFLEALAIAGFAGTVGGLVAMFIGDWMFPFAYTQTISGYDYVVYNWLLMGVVPAIDFMTRSQRAQVEPCEASAS